MFVAGTSDKDVKKPLLGRKWSTREARGPEENWRHRDRVQIEGSEIREKEGRTNSAQHVNHRPLDGRSQDVRAGYQIVGRVWWDCPNPGYVETEQEDQIRRYIDIRETEMAQNTVRWIRRAD